MWDTFKLLVVAVAGSLYTYLQPVYNPMKVLAIVFFADITAGILVDLLVKNDRLRLKKFLVAIAFLAIYLSIIASTYVIGKHMGDQQQALFLIKTLTYVFLYFYISNTFRNLRLLAPSNGPIAFIDYWLGLQIVKRLPDLAEYLGPAKTKKKKNEKD